MKTTNTAEEIQSIIKALAMIHKQPFQNNSDDGKYNAQRALSGLTHYVDDDTLRWHKSRVISSRAICDGLLFRTTCSDALDMQNTKRGFRSVVHDLFGSCTSRPGLENTERTSQKAIAKSDAEEIDLVAHYRAALATELRRAAESAAELENALAAMK